MPGHDLGHELKSEWVEDIRDWSGVTLAPGTVHMATKEAEQGSASRSPAVDEKMFGEVDGALGVQSASLGVHPPVLQTPSRSSPLCGPQFLHLSNGANNSS